MNILCVGDIVGKPGRQALIHLIDDIKKEFELDFVIVNAENAAGGTGLTSRVAKEIVGTGCDVLTMGDHIWDHMELKDYLDESEQIIRPANFPNGAPGRGWCVRTAASGQKVGVINMLGRTFMRFNVNCPFRELEKIVEEIRKQTPIIIVDMHAEATSEKVAIGHFIDGKVSALFGTHTHIQTADEKILSGGTAYITDLGMTGPYDSVIGVNKESIIKRFLTSMPTKNYVAKDEVVLSGIVLDIDEKTGKANKIARLQKEYHGPVSDQE